VLDRIDEEEVIQPEDERKREKNQEVLLHFAPAMEIHAFHVPSLHAPSGGAALPELGMGSCVICEHPK
jgi:hypothetical protein